MNTGQFNIHDEGFTEDQKQRVKEDLSRLVIRRRTIRFQKIWQRGLKNGLHQTL
jgi:hypothetical protein